MMNQSGQSATRQTLSVGMMYGMVLPASCQATVYEVCKVVPSCCGANMCATQSDLAWCASNILFMLNAGALVRESAHALGESPNLDM